MHNIRMNAKIKNLKKLTLILFLTLITVFSMPMNTFAYVDWPENVNVLSEGAILMDADSGAVIYGKNMHEHYYPASITKLLTALIVVENCNLDDTVTFSKNAVYNVEPGSSSAGIDAGDTLTVRDCLYAMLLQSANEAANALAEHTAGSIEAFAKMMNDKAASLGCKDSHFANPSGLNNPEHYTSAYDYALISRAAFKNPTVTEIDSATYYNLPPTSRVPTGQTLYSHHSMLRKNSGNYYQNAICGKTGYTTLAGNTLVTYARTDKIGLITVVLNGNKTHYVDTQSLLDFGFANFKNVKLKSSDIGTNFKSNLALIPNFNEYTIEPDDNASITLPNDADVSEVESAMDFEQSESPTANSLCKIDYKYNGRPVGSVDIIAKKNASYEANTNNNTGEVASTAAGNSNPTSTANTGTQGFSNVMLSISKKNMIIGGGIAGIILLLIIIISIRVHLAKKKSDLSDRELRIYGLLKNGWSATDCGISEDEAKYIIEKH